MLKYFSVKGEKFMKLYRALYYNQDISLESNLFRKGVYNEALNLLYSNAFSPSEIYLPKSQKRFCDSNTFSYNVYDPNTFSYYDMMLKFFYPSLIDACDWIKDGDFLILEIDLPIENIQKYFGVGYYCQNKLEVCLPYKDLYTLASQNDKSKDKAFNKLLSLYEHSYIDGHKSQIKKLGKKLLIPNLTTENSNLIYPYLCFPSKVDFSFLYLTQNDDFTKYSCSIEYQRPDFFANNLLCYGCPNYPYLMHEGLAFIEEENEVAKRILSQTGKSFRPKL